MEAESVVRSAAFLEVALKVTLTQARCTSISRSKALASVRRLKVIAHSSTKYSR